MSSKFDEFVKTVSMLRHPTKGCPWDLKQDHKSLRSFMIEEAYEASDAMGGDNKLDMIEELGDVLLQVVLNSQILSETSDFSVEDVIEAIDQKMKRRHPHVFEENFQGGKDIKSIKDNWAKIKSDEKSSQVNEGIFSKFDSSPLSSLQLASKIGKKANKIGFDWNSVDEVWQQFKSEVDELSDEITVKEMSSDRIEDELGDVIFTLSQLARHLNIDPEVAARRGNRKFLSRFAGIEVTHRG